MDVEPSHDNDPILTQLISEFVIKEFIEVSDEEDVSEVCLQVFTHGLHVVQNSDRFPLGVLDYEVATALLGKPGPLSTWVASFAPICVCSPQTQVRDVMFALQEFGLVPWFLLQAEEKIVGLIPSTWIFYNLGQYFRQRPERARRFWTNLKPKTLFDTLDRSLIDPVIPPSQPLCYCCPNQFNNQKPHRLQPVDVRVDANGNYVCRYHTSQRVIPSIGCTAC
jgi:hypothetical protein